MVWRSRIVCQSRSWRNASLVFLILTTGSVSGCSQTVSEHVPGGGTVGVSTQSLAPVGSSLQIAPEDALTLWKRTLLAARTSTGVAKVIETRFTGTGADHDVVQFAVVESEGRQRGAVARYRLTYTAPDTIKGVVILNDGHNVWRYNSHKRLIARQASITAPIPPELEDGVAAVPIQADGAHPEIEMGPERVAGRSTQVLALRTRRSGRIVERRWIDKETGRTMRLEQYAGRDAHIVRRVEIEEFHLLKASKELDWAARQFAPTFPNTVRVVESGTSHTRHLAEAEDVARRVQLPLHVRGFALRSVDRMPENPVPVAGLSSYAVGAAAPASAGTPSGGSIPAPSVSAAAPCNAASSNADCGNTAATKSRSKSGTTQLYYSKGNQAISIFVSDIPGLPNHSGASAIRRPAAGGLVARKGWAAANLAAGRSGFVSTLQNGAAVAWSGPSGNSYVAVAHMPLADLLPVVRAFVADRDDAPGAFAAGR